MKTIGKGWKAIKWIAVAILGVYAIYVKYRLEQEIKEHKKSINMASFAKLRVNSLMRTIEDHKDEIPKYAYDWQIGANEAFKESYEEWLFN